MEAMVIATRLTAESNDRTRRESDSVRPHVTIPVVSSSHTGVEGTTTLRGEKSVLATYAIIALPREQ
jgi:hypothetical protein